MLRYKATYQHIADDFAIAHGNGDWIGAHYIGHFHEPTWPGSNHAPAWLAIEPIWKDHEDCFLGLYHYILINEQEVLWYVDLHILRDKQILLDTDTVRFRQEINKYINKL